MFGFSKRRLAALREAARDAAEAHAQATRTGGPLDPAHAERLVAALHAVIDHDLDEVFGDDALEAEFRAAKALREELEAFARRAAQRVRHAADAAAGPAVARALGLTRCTRCDGGVFYVRERATLSTPSGPDLEVAVAVCATCGDVRLTFPDRDAVERLADDPQYKRIELAAGAPFRGG